jgi:glycosyltransferase involved in cell wall biosynthesis
MVCYNSGVYTISFLGLCLRSVLEQDRGTELMLMLIMVLVVVVDDVSTDGDVEAIVKLVGAE